VSEQQSAPPGPDIWKRLATQLRVDSIRSTTAAGSGHPTSSLSAADLMAVLLASHLRYDLEQPKRLRGGVSCAGGSDGTAALRPQRSPPARRLAIRSPRSAVRTRASWCSSARWRGIEFHVYGQVRGSQPGALLRDLYRRAAVGIGRRRPADARLAAVRGDLCSILHQGFRSDPHGRDLASHLEPRRLTRRCIDRRGRPLTDGTGGSGDDARGARQRGALSVLRERDREARGGDGCPGRYPYLRTTREKTAVLYPRTEDFPIGGCKVLRRSDRDRVGIVAAGITVHEALKAYDQLRARGVMTRIIDLYSIKPVDRATLREAARECSGGLLLVEDHHPEGGLADAVAEAFDGIAAPTMRRLGVRSMPGSATPEEQLSVAGIDANAIVESVAAGLVGARDAHTGLTPALASGADDDRK
jgi:hypothetical protein